MKPWILAAALPAFAACAHAQEARKEPPAAPAPAVASAPAPPAAPAPRACSGDDGCAASELCVDARCVAITPGLAACGAQVVHFDFDRADLSAADRATLARSARCLEALAPPRVVIDGNCDERGTAQYNVALGFRRAAVVAKYLSDLGVPATRLEELSHGKEVPLCTESTEACWAMNRRSAITPDGTVAAAAARH